MMFETSTSYTYNGSPDTAVHVVATEFSGYTNRKNFFSTNITAHQYFTCKLCRRCAYPTMFIPADFSSY